MLRNYLNIAFRNLSKHKFYTFINIIGLSVGLCCFMLITLFVVDELSYDQWHTNGDRIHRMDFSGNINGSEFITALASAPTAQTMKADFPQVEDACRIRETGNWLIRKSDGEDTYSEDDAAFVDPNFFSFFQIPLSYGDAETALEKPRTLALSTTLAEKVFGQEDPVGKKVVIDNEEEWEVTAVFKIPENTHFDLELVFTMKSREEAQSTMWMSFNFNTYLLLQEGTSPEELEGYFPDLIESRIGPEIERFMGASMSEFRDAGNSMGFSLFPMTDIYLQSQKLGELDTNGDIKYIYIFSAIAAFILLLACINFMNLATARSAGRAKEVGIRKVLGAYRKQLIYQFLSEAFIITFISILFALALTMFSLPLFNELAEKSISAGSIFTPSFLMISLAILVVVGLLSGSYPSFYLSAFRPIETLKGKLNLGMKKSGIRSTLVILQFSVSIMMIIGTAVVFDQLSFIQNKKLGFSKDHVLMLHDPWLLNDKVDAFKSEALDYSDIKAGTLSSFLPVNTSDNNNAWFPGTNASGSETYVFHEYQVDHDYTETLDIEMALGRSFSREFPSDSSAVLLNEAAVQRLGWSDNPIGKTISTFGGNDTETTIDSYTVIGVVKDFHFMSLKDEIEPLVFELNRSRGFISFKISPTNIDETINFLADKWDEFAPGQPFEYSFLDQLFYEMYENEQKLGKIFGTFAFLAILIACLGLYGLAAFTAEQRKKEIGVRKVLGASIASIVGLLSGEFLKLVGISFIIGSILAGWLMNQWLMDFENRTTLGVGIFATAGFLASIIAWLTISFQSWKAARLDPAKSLKDE